MSEHIIRASLVRGVLAAHRLNERVRWAAVSAHVDTGACGSSWRHARLYREDYLGMAPYRMPSTMTTFHGGDLLLAIEKVRTARGLVEVKKTWGISYRALVKQIKGVVA